MKTEPMIPHPCPALVAAPSAPCPRSFAWEALARLSPVLSPFGRRQPLETNPNGHLSSAQTKMQPELLRPASRACSRQQKAVAPRAAHSASSFLVICLVASGFISAQPAMALTNMSTLGPEGVGMAIASPTLRVMVGKAGLPSFRIPPPASFVQQQKSVDQQQAASATFTIQYLNAGQTNYFGDVCVGFPTEVQGAFTYAANILASLINSPVPIKINACWANMGTSGILGHSGARTFYRDFTGALQSGTLYPVALANMLYGSDLNSTTEEIVIAYNAQFTSWYFGTDGVCPGTKIDFVQVVTHEIIHGLGFAGSMSVSGGIGSWGLSGYPTIYDRFTENASGQKLITFSSGSAALYNELVGGNVYFNGPHANAGNGGSRVKLYAPNPWAVGSSYAHLDESFNGTANAMMTYSINYGEAIHNPGPVTMGILADDGWSTLSSPTVTASDGTYTDKALVSWDSVSGASYYRVYRASTAGGAKSALNGWIAATSYDDTTATPGVIYYYSARAAEDSSGSRASLYSPENSGWRALSAPTVTASDGPYTDRVLVTASTVTGASYFGFYRATTAGGAKTALSGWTTATSYNDTTATPGGIYYYSAQAAVDASGTRASAHSTEDSGWRALSVPTVTASDGPYPDRVLITASAVTGASYFGFYRAPTAGGAKTPLSGWISGTTYNDTAATPGIMYYYSAQAAANSSGGSASAYSAEDSGWRALSAPTVTASDGTYTDRVSANWGAVSGASYYQVYRAPTVGGSKTTLSGWIAATSYNDTTTTPDVTYYYSAQAAVDASGTRASAYSTEDSGWRALSPPTAYAVIGGGTYCSGGTGVTVGLSGSETNVNYYLKRDGTNAAGTVAGSGSALSFGNQTVAESYTVVATNASNPSNWANMTGSAVVTVNVSPPAHTVTGGGAYCAGGTGVAVGLSNSETNVSYYLKRDGTNAAGTVAGSGSALSFGNQTNAGTFTVIATNVSSGCWAAMSGNAIVTLDTTLPSITWYMTNVLVSADASCHALMPDITGMNYILAVDNCNSVTVTQSVAINVLLSLGTNEVVLGAFDAAGNVAYCTNYVLVVDTTTPSITCATNKTVECTSTWTFDMPTASDTCGSTTITIVSTTTNTAGHCGTTFDATRTWMATDTSTNTAMCSQTVTVEDTTPPSITCATNKTVECGSVWNFDPPTASDTCGSATITIVSTTTNTAGHSGNTFDATRTWMATDDCTNTATCSQTVTVEDTTPPSITCATNKTVERGSVWSFNPPEASDACSGTNVAVTLVGVVTNGTCPEVLTATWLALDACGNTNTCSQSVTNVDTTPPVLVCATNKTVECGSVWTFDPPAASDACSGTNVTVSLVGVVTNGTCPAVFTATWVALDACGNTNTCSQSVTNLETTPPVLICATNKTVECGSVWSFDSPAASDACSGTNVTVTLAGVVTNGTCPAVFTATWAAIDACGNTNTCTQSVTNVNTTPLNLTFGPAKWLTNGGVRLTLFGTATGSVTIRWTPDITKTLSDWETLIWFTNFTGSTQYIDSTATNIGRRFYRAVTP